MGALYQSLYKELRIWDQLLISHLSFVTTVVIITMLPGVSYSEVLITINMNTHPVTADINVFYISISF